MVKRKKICLLFCALVLGGACAGLTACGGEFVGRNVSSTGVVSQGGVSGEAVSGAAVEEEKETNGNPKWNEIQQMVADVYPYHSSRCVYIQGSDNKLGQRTLEGKKLQTFFVPGLKSKYDDWCIEAVTDHEILYTVDASEKPSELWSVPLEDTDGKESLAPERAQKILEGENINVIYADSDYIACRSDESGYFDYDREEKKKTAVDMADSGQVYDKTDEYVITQGMGTSDTILLSKRVFEEGGYELRDLYVHKVGSGKVKKIHDVVEDVEEVDLINDYVYFDNRIFYNIDKEVWCYDVEREEKRLLLTEDMLSSFWQGGPEECIDKIHVDSTKLYIEAYTPDVKKIFSCSWRLGEKQECKWEKDLDTCLNKMREDFEGVFIETIQLGRCFYAVHIDWDVSKRYCYDLERETNQKVNKDDPENCAWWLNGYRY